MAYLQSVPYNPNSLGDTMGVGHLEVINYFNTNYGAQALAIQDLAQRESFITTTMTQIGNTVYAVNSNIPQVFAQIPGYTGSLTTVDFTNNYAAIVNGLPGVTASTKQQIISLLQTLTTFPISDDYSVASALNAIMGAEITFLKSSNTDPALLNFVSVLKFSLYGLWNNPTDPAPASVKWGHIISDGVGCLIGGLLGGAAATTIWHLCT